MGPAVAADAREAWLADAAAGFRRNGVVVLRNAIARPHVEAVHAALARRQLRTDDHDERPFQPAPLRPRVAVSLEGPLADPAMFAPPSVLALVQRLLGEEMIVGEVGVMISRPGEGPREVRRDAIPLFGGLAVESDVPSAAVTMLAPLTDVGPGAGFPEYRVGSHRAPIGAAAETTDAAFRSALEAGSVVLSDWRILHGAGVNTSGATHLGVYVSFQRKWLFSLSGSEYKPGLHIPPATLDEMPEAYRPLVAWALHQNKTDDVSEFMHLWLGRLFRRLRIIRGG